MKKRIRVHTRFDLTKFGIAIWPTRSGVINNLVNPPKIFKRYTLSFMIWPFTMWIDLEIGEDPWTYYTTPVDIEVDS